jgi:hypothetical protein
VETEERLIIHIVDIYYLDYNFQCKPHALRVTLSRFPVPLPLNFPENQQLDNERFEGISVCFLLMK